MPKFTDTKSREWTITINVGTAMRLKEDGINFHELAENKYAKYLALEQDDLALGEILWSIVRPQAEPLKITKEDFCESLEGESFYSAWEAFASAYINFTRNPEIRSALRKGSERAARHKAKVAKALEEKMGRLEKLADERVQKKIAEMTDENLAAMLDGEYLDGTRKISQPPTLNEPSSVLPAG